MASPTSRLTPNALVTDQLNIGGVLEAFHVPNNFHVCKGCNSLYVFVQATFFKNSAGAICKNMRIACNSLHNELRLLRSGEPVIEQQHLVAARTQFS